MDPLIRILQRIEAKVTQLTIERELRDTMTRLEAKLNILLEEKGDFEEVERRVREATERLNQTHEDPGPGPNPQAPQTPKK